MLIEYSSAFGPLSERAETGVIPKVILKKKKNEENKTEHHRVHSKLKFKLMGD